MPDYRRWFVPGASYFFTVVTADRAPIFRHETARAGLRRAFSEVKARWPFEIAAIVLLPDHLHAIWTLTPGDADFATRWAAIKRRFTCLWLEAGGPESLVSPAKARDRRRGVWQRRYWEHVLRDEEDFANHGHYIHFNPVKHGLVSCPKDWPYSSFARFVRSGDYPSDWACGGHGPPDLRKLDEIAIE